MTNSNKKKIWQHPWGYPESVAIVLGIILVGFLLQLTIGSFSFYLLTSPVNYIIGALMIVLCAASMFFKKNRFIAWFSGVSLSVTLILALLVLSLILGLTPQTSQIDTPDTSNVFILLGFDRMTRTWAFVLVYFITLLSLGCLIARRLRAFNWRDYGFYFNHMGLWIVFFAAGLGYADIERYVMHVTEGETEWRVFDEKHNMIELPIAIHLIDFDMEEYPPKLTIIDRETGEAQPVKRPEFYQLDPKNMHAKLGDWLIQVDEYIHEAVRTSDSTYREVPMPGSTPAARIKAVHSQTGEQHRGWVCGGNQAQLYMTLPLSEQFAVVMTQTEPKRYMSDVEVYTQDGREKKGVLEVNKPLQIGHWTVYQYGYDDAMARLSSYSSIELVRDPWKNTVYLGFLLIALGTIAMIWNGKSIRQKYAKKASKS